MIKFASMIGDFNKQMLKPATDKKLSRAVSKHFSTREPDVRKPGIHVSDLVNPCFRRLAYKILYPTKRDPSGPPAGQRVFAEGKAAHFWWQNRIYGPMGKLSGKWECSVCKGVETGFMPDHPCQNEITLRAVEIDETVHTTCQKIGAEWLYAEYDVEIEVGNIMVVGNCDGLLYWDGKWYLLEIKTMRPDLWKLTTRADPGHHLQASIYAHALGEKEVMISCIEKSTWRTRDFALPRLTNALEWVNDHVEMAASFAKEDPQRAPRKCPKIESTRAARCAFKKLCFAT